MGVKRGWIGRYSAIAALVLLVSCTPLVPPDETPAPTPPTALLLGATRGPAISSLGIDAEDARAALASFVESCPRLLAREDASGLTSARHWEPACRAAPTWPAGEALRFFSEHFETAVIGEGNAFATGYYEPEIAGQARTRSSGRR